MFDEREQLARIDLTLADIEMRQEQLRQLKSYELWRVVATVVGGLGVWSAVLVALLAHVWK
jgi:NO-binding membrane sensor protein with MHYT domain